MAIEVSTTRLGDDLARGYTLPATWYYDPARQQIERERIFARSWQYAGRADQVAKPGDFFAGRAGHIPVVVVRDGEGALRGFVNVCRHRGHEVASGAGNRKTLQCPYHAWTYGLDGCLRTVPRSEREQSFPKDELSLLPVQVDTWGPLVFVNPDPLAPALTELLGDLPAIVAESGLDFETLEHDTRRDWVLDANWKIGIENYLECYHCPVAHPGFSELLDVDPDEYRLSIQRWFSTQRAHVRDSVLSGTRSASYDPHGEIQEAQYHFLWPNITINIEAGRANFSVDSWWPDGPQRTVGISDSFFGRDVPRQTRDEMMAFSAQVGAEDDALVTSVQRGLASGMVPRGRLLLESEPLIAHFQGLLLEALDGS